MYHSILVHHAVPSHTQNIGEEFIFLQDNNAKHTFKLYLKYLKIKKNKKTFNLMMSIAIAWSYSIEKLGDEMDREIHMMVQQILEVFENVCMIFGETIYQTLEKLLSQAPKLCKAELCVKVSQFD